MSFPAGKSFSADNSRLFLFNSDFKLKAESANGSAFSKFQVTSAKTKYLEPLYSADTVNLSEFLESAKKL
jgi:hypothetical protein